MSAPDRPGEALRPEHVRAGYSQERPRTPVLTFVIAPVLLVALVAAMVQWSRLTTPNADSAAAVRSWEEDIPEIVLTPAEQQLADSAGAYRGAVPVLNFHAVSSSTSAGMKGKYVTSTDRFARQMAVLDRAGFTTIRLTQLRDFLAGKGTLPEKPILLTFDDGHATTLHVVDPILEKHDFTAVSFPITGEVPMSDEPSYYMTARELDELKDTGRWEIGSHTHAQHRWAVGDGGVEVSALDHALETDGGVETVTQWRTRVDGDLRQSRSWLDDEVGGDTSAFAYPFGAHGLGSGLEDAPTALSSSLRANGFSLAFIGQDTSPYRAILPGDDPLTLRRLGMLGATTPGEMMTMIYGAMPSLMPQDPTQERWSGSGAGCTTRESGQKAVVVSPEETGYVECRTRLNASTWQDYRVSTTVVGATDETPGSVVVRDGQDWSQPGSVEVTVSGRSALVRERTDGQPRTLGRVRLGSADADGRTVEITVRERRASVRVDDQEVTATLRAEVAGGLTLGVAGEAGRSVAFVAPRLEPSGSGDDAG